MYIFYSVSEGYLDGRVTVYISSVLLLLLQVLISNIYLCAHKIFTPPYNLYVSRTHYT